MQPPKQFVLKQRGLPRIPKAWDDNSKSKVVFVPGTQQASRVEATLVARRSLIKHALGLAPLDIGRNINLHSVKW